MSPGEIFAIVFCVAVVAAVFESVMKAYLESKQPINIDGENLSSLKSSNKGLSETDIKRIKAAAFKKNMTMKEWLEHQLRN